MNIQNYLKGSGIKIYLTQKPAFIYWDDTLLSSKNNSFWNYIHWKFTERD